MELSEPLSEGVSYRAAFYVSLLDSIWYATRNIGMHFSGVAHSQNQNELLSLSPQVNYSDTMFLIDKLRWVEVSGSFVAEGGERFLAIGNFDSDAETDTVFVSGGGNGVLQPESFWHEATYFIDDVSVIPDSIYLSNEELEIKNDEFLVYPNPATDQLTIETEVFSNKTVELFEISGRMVLQLPLKAGRQTIGVGHLPRGVYVVVLNKEGMLVERKKLILH